MNYGLCVVLLAFTLSGCSHETASAPGAEQTPAVDRAAESAFDAWENRNEQRYANSGDKFDKSVGVSLDAAKSSVSFSQHHESDSASETQPWVMEDAALQTFIASHPVSGSYASGDLYYEKGDRSAHKMADGRWVIQKGH